MNSLNILPQSPSSAINFIDGAAEAQLKAMVAARNGYSAIALSKLQSIRDAKMKAQAGQPTPPPLSVSIPQQLDQLESPMGMPQQAPQQMPQQAPQQPMGIASIGGSPTGAGGGMVAFKDGGGVKHLAAGEFLSGNSQRYRGPYSMSSGERDRELNEKMESVSRLPLSEPLQLNEYGDKYSTEPSPVAEEQSQLSGPGGPSFVQRPAGGITTSTTDKAGASPTTGPSPAAGLGLGSLASREADAFRKQLTDPNKRALQAQDDVVKAMEKGQKDLDDIYNPEARQRALGSQAERDTYLQDRQKRLEASMPDPYAKTQQSLESLTSELSKSKEHAPYQSLLSMAAKLMSNKSPNFLAALGEGSTVGLQTYAELGKANKQQEMALMQAQTSLSSAQDARKQGQYDRASNEMKDYFSAKEKAYDFGLEAQKQKSLAAIGIAGEKAKKPKIEIEQAQSLFAISTDLRNYNLQVDRLRIEAERSGIESKKLELMQIPDEAKVSMFLVKYPQFRTAIENERALASFARNYAAGLREQKNSQLTDDEVIASALKATKTAALQFPTPIGVPSGTR